MYIKEYKNFITSILTLSIQGVVKCHHHITSSFVLLSELHMELGHLVHHTLDLVLCGEEGGTEVPGAVPLAEA